MNPKSRFKALFYIMRMAVLLLSFLTVSTSLGLAGPLLPAGDTVLRHDIQVLADRGIITGPVTSWPLAWGPILSQISQFDLSEPQSPDVEASLMRVRTRARWETRMNAITFSATVGGAEAPAQIRSFENTPRESVELGGGMSMTTDRFTVSLNGQVVDQARGSGEVRADGSILGIAIGNYLVSANTLDRWWGPGWDGSIILSNNARPIPAISVDRTFTDAFASKWLRWIGPWDISLIMGQLESLRAVPRARFLGMRFNFRPLPSLELGLSRSAQWCGDGRPCNASTLLDLLLGQDNAGDGGVVANNEPGNQLAGLDFRWSVPRIGLPIALYGQFIGEDEAGGFPSRYLGQVGAELSGSWRRDWSWRWYGEFSGTSCQFHESSPIFDCGYNHSIYQTGYRYRGRSIGHGADNDAELLSTGLLLAAADGLQWQLKLRAGELNRGGAPESRNSLTATPMDIDSLDILHSRPFADGTLALGVGYERLDSPGTSSGGDMRLFFQWRSGY